MFIEVSECCLFSTYKTTDAGKGNLRVNEWLKRKTAVKYSLVQAKKKKRRV